MKKLGIAAGIIFTLIVFGIIIIQQKYSKKTETNIKVGFILNGSKDDHSWGQSHYQGMEKCKDEVDNLIIEYRENVPEDESSIEVMEELISSGCNIIFCNSYSYGEFELAVAKKYPDIYFFHATGVEEAANLSTYFGRIYQIRYLCGIVAGLQTESNEIGYIAAYDISEVNRGINAFTLGVKSVNPDAKVYVKFCNSWLDNELTTNAAIELFDNHNIDVMTVHTDSLCAYDEAEKRNIYIIGYNYDNREKYPDYFLTAAVWRWENFYIPRIHEVLQDKFVSKHYWESVDTGMVDIAPLTANVKEGIREKVDTQLQRMKDGTFDVFYGPIYDNNGVLRVSEGESMKDETMLNNFDWYVEGVEIDE